MPDYNPWLGTLTAAFEIFAGIWMLTRKDRKNIHRISALLFFLLAGYQLLEVLICYHHLEELSFLSRLAFLDVTWLPALTVLLLALLNNKKSPLLNIYAIVSLSLALVFSVWILIDTRFVSSTVCDFIYASYQHPRPVFILYGLYYEIVQFSVIFILISMMALEDDRLLRKRYAFLQTGVLLYLIPSFLVMAFVPQVTESALPSVMCHFALFYGIFLFIAMSVKEKKTS